MAMVMRMNFWPVLLRSEDALQYSRWHQCKCRDEDAGCDDRRCEHHCTIIHALIVEYLLPHQVHAVSRDAEQAERGNSEAMPKFHRDILAYGCQSRKG